MLPELKQRAKPVTPALASSGLSPLMQRLYANRGVTTADEIDLALKGLLPPQQLRGVAEAAELLADAIEGEARVVIVGSNPFSARSISSAVVTPRFAYKRCISGDKPDDAKAGVTGLARC